MKLFLFERTDHYDYDAYTDMVVSAETQERATEMAVTKYGEADYPVKVENLNITLLSETSFVEEKIVVTDGMFN